MATKIQIQSVIYHNQKDTLLRAYESLANAVRVNRQNTSNPVEVVLHYGDASSSPVYSEQELEALKSQFAPYFEFRYTFFNENTGTSKGHNRLGLTCEANYIVVMNPDVILCPCFFEKMLSPFQDEALNAGISEARQTPVEHPKAFNRTTLETEWATGACFMIPAALYREIGGFDEQTFFMYCDDVDISWRVRLTGKKIYYRPDCVVYHAKRLSSGGHWTPTEAEQYYSREAALLMAYKWSNKRRFKKLYDLYISSDDEISKKVIVSFNELKRQGKLPKQLDPDHKIAKFVGDNYTKHRYVL